MQDKQFKLIYFSLRGSEVKQICLGWKSLIGVAVLAFTVILAITYGAIGLFTDVFHNYSISHLSKANSELTDQLDLMEHKVAGITQVVENIEKRDKDYRVFYDMPTSSHDVGKLGVGGRAHEPLTSTSLDVRIKQKSYEVTQALTDLGRRLNYAEQSRDEIFAKFDEEDQILKTTPSVRPVIGGRISAKFGYRIDPFVEKLKLHEGIDFSVPRGTGVVATAAGKVVQVVTYHKPNQGYGRQVIIDHNNGFRTRYAHLQKTLVKEGQWVTRHTLIGKVGDTGRSTGPHLHYEVLKGKNQVDPAVFILE